MSQTYDKKNPFDRVIQVGDTIQYKSYVKGDIKDFEVKYISDYIVMLECRICREEWFTAKESILIRNGVPVLPLSFSTSYNPAEDISNYYFKKGDKVE